MPQRKRRPPKYFVARPDSFGKGVGKALIVCSKIHPASALKITSRPMKTITLVSAGAFSTGFRMMRWISTPPAKEIATVRKKAAEQTEEVAKKVGQAAKPAAAAVAAGLGDPMQLWSALTQQFQQIAASAMKEASKATAVDLTKNLAKGVARGMATQAEKAVKSAAAAPAKKRAATKKVAKKATPSDSAERGMRRKR